MANGSEVLTLFNTLATMPLFFMSSTATRLFGQTTYGGTSGNAVYGAEGFGWFYTDRNLDFYWFSSIKSFARMIPVLAC